jgi:hypothetical protein
MKTGQGFLKELPITAVCKKKKRETIGLVC